MNGWLAAQLPQVMAKDAVIAGFVQACEEIADSLRDRVSTVEYELDVDLASPEMLSYLAAWLGVELQTVAVADPEARDAQRRLIRAVGQVLGWRGTRRGVEILLEALTGARAQVSDSGGVFGLRDELPPPDATVRVVLDDTGGLSERQLHAFLAEELPVGAKVDLRVKVHRRGRSDAG